MSLTLFGDPTVRTNRVILIWGVGPAVDGMFLVKNVKHELADGYGMSVELQRNGLKKLFGAAARRFDRKVQGYMDGFSRENIRIRSRRFGYLNRTVRNT
jgi:hypothetical protein